MFPYVLYPLTRCLQFRSGTFRFVPSKDPLQFHFEHDGCEFGWYVLALVDAVNQVLTKACRDEASDPGCMGVVSVTLNLLRARYNMINNV